MIKFFYDLWVEHPIEINDADRSSFHIGYFSSIRKVREVIEILKKQPGFCDHPIECFQIQKFGVRFSHNVTEKSGVSLYVLSHEYEDEYYDYWSVFDPFATRVEAEKKLNKLLKRKFYREKKDGFLISCWVVDHNIEWKEGFTSV